VKYFVIYDRGRGPQVFPTDDYEAALQFAAQEKVKGSDMVQLAESMPGELVLTATIVNDAGQPATLSRSPRRRSSKKGSKRTPTQLKRLRSRLLKEVQTHPGKRIDQLGEILNVESKDLVLPMKQLVADKEIKKRGKARATVYLPAEKSSS
jgi:hypothetical protein